MPDKSAMTWTSMINIMSAIHGLFFIIIKYDMEGAILSERLDRVISWAEIDIPESLLRR